MPATSQRMDRPKSLIAICLSIFGLSLCPRTFANDKWADYFPKVTLQTQDGKDVRFYDDLVKGKTVIISLFYTSCDVCERATKNIEQLQKALGARAGRDVYIYSITLDPAHDTPKVLKAYAEKHGAKPGWLFLTGKSEDIALLRNKLGLSNLTPEMRAKLGLPKKDSNKDTDQKLHTGMIVIRNDAYNRQTHTSALATPDQILQIIERMKPPSELKK